jgi:AsmA-like C-terminal region
MRAKRTLKIAVAALAGAVVLLAAAAFCPPVQTWAARRVLASVAGPRASIQAASAGWGTVSLTGLRLNLDGSVLEVPSAEARVGVLSALLGGKIAVTSLVAKRWTLDLTRPAQAARMAPSTAAGSGGSSWVKKALGAAFSAFNVPARASLDGVELEGIVVLSDQAGRPISNALVVVTGGGLAAGSEGRFQCILTAVLNDSSAAVSALRVVGTLSTAMDASGTFTRADLQMDATARGRQFPTGIGLSGLASASRAAGAVSYAFTLERGSETIASIDAKSNGGPLRVAGTWHLNLKDTDLAPFALGRALPAFDAAGEGSYEVDTANGDVHAVGKCGVSADRLSVISEDLSALGRVEIVADFDMARAGNSLRVDRLVAHLAGTSQVASILALQPFEFNASTGELKVARPSGDLVGISVTGIPLGWLRGPLPWIEAAGGDLQGEFAMRADNGRLALRTKAPLSASNVSITRGGKPVASGVDLSAFLLADYAPNGWQVQLAPFAVRSQGVELLSLEARFGRLSDTDDPIKAEGSWSVSLPALLSQPLASSISGIAGGEASGSFTASLGAIRSVRIKAALSDLVSSGPAGAALPSVGADVSADLDPAGLTTFVAPLKLTYPDRTADLVLSGTVSTDERGRVVNAAVSGGHLLIGDLGVVAVLCGARLRNSEQPPAGGTPVPAQAREPIPFWPARRGRVSVSVDNLVFPRFEVGEVRGALALDPGFLELDDISAKYGDDCRARFSGKVMFSTGTSKAYSLQSTLTVTGLDSAPFFRAIHPEDPPVIEGKFDLTGQLTSTGEGVQELVDDIQGQARLSSRAGIFRALRTGAIEPLRQNQSRIEDALDTVTSLFGKKADKTFDAIIDAAEGLSNIHYDQLNILASRGTDLDLHFTEISLIAPEEHITGSGTVTHVDGASIRDEPLSADLVLSVRGRLETLMGAVGMLKDDGRDDLGFAQLYQPVHLGGTLRDIDQDQWRDMLVRAPLRKAGGLFDKLLGH